MSNPRTGNLNYKAPKVEMGWWCLRNREALWLEVVREREGGGKGRGVAQLHQAFSELTNTYTLIHSRL